MHIADEIANELGRLQAGAFARWQLLPRGADDAAIRRRVTAGAWLRHAMGVYRLPSHPVTWQQELWLAWLSVGPDAVVSHEAAAQLHRIPSVPRGRVTLIADHPRHDRSDRAVIHQICDVRTDHRTAVDGIPVTTIPRTIVDLAAVVHPARLRRVVEDAKHQQLVSYTAVGECLRSVARRGKPGVRALTIVLDELAGSGAPVTMSVLERRLLVLLKSNGLPPPIVQMSFPGRALPDRCVDVGYPEAKLIVEADGRAWHSRIADLKRDHDRDAEAARHGWLTLRLLHEHIVDDPEGTSLLVRDVFHTRLAQLAS